MAQRPVKAKNSPEPRVPPWLLGSMVLLVPFLCLLSLLQALGVSSFSAELIAGSVLLLEALALGFFWRRLTARPLRQWLGAGLAVGLWLFMGLVAASRLFAKLDDPTLQGAAVPVLMAGLSLGLGLMLAWLWLLSLRGRSRWQALGLAALLLAISICLLWAVVPDRSGELASELPSEEVAEPPPGH